MQWSPAISRYCIIHVKVHTRGRYIIAPDNACILLSLINYNYNLNDRISAELARITHFSAPWLRVGAPGGAPGGRRPGLPASSSSRFVWTTPTRRSSTTPTCWWTSARTCLKVRPREWSVCLCGNGSIGTHFLPICPWHNH